MRLIDIGKVAPLDIMHNVICDDKVAHKMLEFLNEQPTVQPQGIDKDRLLKELMRTDHLNYYDYDIGAYIECIPVYAVIHIINQQPTTDGWIPCSERLPEKEDLSDDGFVLVQEGQGAMFKGRYDTDMSTWYDDVGLDFSHGVVAWQPLPQPYKESE